MPTKEIILICSKEEWKIFKTIIRLYTSLRKYPYGEYLSFCKKNKEYYAFNTGAGKILSGGAAQYIIDKYKPNRIFLIGCAGAISQRLNLQDIVIGDKFVQYDYTECMGMENEFYNKDTFIKYKPNVKFNKNTIEDVKTGLIASADTDVDNKTRRKLTSSNYKKKEILCGDWESFSVAKVCKLNKTNCIIVRGISDIPKHTRKGFIQKNEYRNNIKPVLQKCLKVIYSII